MIPTYALLMASAKFKVLRRPITSHFVPFLLCLGWIAAVVVAAAETGATCPQVLEQVMVSLHGGVATISTMFLQKWFTTISWMNLMMLDFLMAREVALDGWDQGVVALHSIALCFMCGPVGYLSHLLTRKVAGRA